MREDMFKVIVERPRDGNTLKSRGGRRARFAGISGKIGSRRFIKMTERDTKSLNENLAPLQRYLAKQVGRPWNKVYSEICASLDASHTVKQHVRDHLEDFVAYRLGIGRDGEFLDKGSPFWSRSDHWRQDLYVDPKDGILKDSAKYWRNQKACRRPAWHQPDRSNARADVVPINDDLKLHRVKGLWFAVTYAGPREASEDTNVYDVIKDHPVEAHERFAASKRQLSRRELKLYGLENDNRAQDGVKPQRHKSKRRKT